MAPGKPQHSRGLENHRPECVSMRKFLEKIVVWVSKLSGEAPCSNLDKAEEILEK